MTDNQLLVDTSDVVHIDNEETIIGTKTFSRDTVVKNLSPMMTNCITEIPQDIKLELNNGTLTVKAGSKVYVPNGSGVFDAYVLTTNLTVSFSESTRQCLYFLSSSKTEIERYPVSICFSGSSAPTGFGQYAMWYDTTNNVIKKTSDSGSTWTVGISLPIGIFTEESVGVVSIDQVFNGFGYIGSTVFALPGVKCLKPNGRNEDGSLKNTEHTTSSVLTTTNNDTGKQTICLYSFAIETYFAGDKKGFGVVYYDDVENKNYASLSETELSFVGDVVRSSGKITSFTPKTVFHALDWNDKSTIAGFSMPSNKHIDLTLGVSGTTYTAPANGWFYFAKIANASNQYMTMYVNNSDPPIFATTIIQPIDGGQARLFLPVKQGDVVGVSYNLAGETRRFCFVYAEGEV